MPPEIWMTLMAFALMVATVALVMVVAWKLGDRLTSAVLKTEIAVLKMKIARLEKDLAKVHEGRRALEDDDVRMARVAVELRKDFERESG